MLWVPLAAYLVKPLTASNAKTERLTHCGLRTLVRLPVFRRIVLVAALILGSHALHDTFSVIRWANAGIAPQAISILWSLAVAAEVVVFFVIGPWLLERLGPPMAMGIAAVAAALRWIVSATTLDFAIIILIQPLHGITFALLHLACMRLLAIHVPPQLAATAQAVYGTLGVGTASACLTMLSGWLYGQLGGQAFLVMAALSLAVLPVVARLSPRATAKR
jgi:PPP family 3-phenylpropionic acid transporter